MRITLNLKKTLEQTANQYFEDSKKYKKKIQGAQEAIVKFQKQLTELQVKQEKTQKTQKITRQQEWFEKFRWFTTTQGNLAIGGKDATSNEIVIKKHTDKTDTVFHTEAPGSPFFALKTPNPTQEEKEEVAQATGSFSRAWKSGLGTIEVFSVKPEQVSKTAPAGMYVAKGAFMVTGKREQYTPRLRLAVGKKDNQIMAGPVSAVKKHCKEYIEIVPGKTKASDIAKKIAKKLEVHPDDILKVLPAGTSEIAK